MQILFVWVKLKNKILRYDSRGVLKILIDMYGRVFFWKELLIVDLWQNPKYDSTEAAPPEVFLWKDVLQNIQQLYTRTLMPKCDFNKAAKQLY